MRKAVRRRKLSGTADTSRCEYFSADIYNDELSTLYPHKGQSTGMRKEKHYESTTIVVLDVAYNIDRSDEFECR